jgi:hypothetical protein
MLDTSSASGTERSGRLNAGRDVIQRALPILCASQRVELFQPVLSFFSFCEELNESSFTAAIEFFDCPRNSFDVPARGSRSVGQEVPCPLCNLKVH